MKILINNKKTIFKIENKTIIKSIVKEEVKSFISMEKNDIDNF